MLPSLATGRTIVEEGTGNEVRLMLGGSGAGLWLNGLFGEAERGLNCVAPLLATAVLSVFSCSAFCDKGVSGDDWEAGDVEAASGVAPDVATVGTALWSVDGEPELLLGSWTVVVDVSFSLLSATVLESLFAVAVLLDSVLVGVAVVVGAFGVLGGGGATVGLAGGVMVSLLGDDGGVAVALERGEICDSSPARGTAMAIELLRPIEGDEKRSERVRDLDLEVVYYHLFRLVFV